MSRYLQCPLQHLPNPRSYEGRWQTSLLPRRLFLPLPRPRTIRLRHPRCDPLRRSRTNDVRRPNDLLAPRTSRRRIGLRRRSGGDRRLGTLRHPLGERTRCHRNRTIAFPLEERRRAGTGSRSLHRHQLSRLGQTPRLLLRFHPQLRGHDARIRHPDLSQLLQGQRDVPQHGHG